MTSGISPKAFFNYINYISIHPPDLGFTFSVIPVLQRENEGLENFTDLCKQSPTERSLWYRYSDFCSAALARRGIIFLSTYFDIIISAVG